VRFFVFRKLDGALQPKVTLTLRQQYNDDMAQYTDRIEFPAIVRPRLQGGSVHKILIADQKIKIETYPGLQGNAESRSVLTIPRSRVSAAKYISPILMALAGYCRISYLDELGREQTLKLYAVNSDKVPQNPYTQFVAEVLEDWRLDKNNATLTQALIIKWDPPSSRRKFLYAIYMLVVIMTGVIWRVGLSGVGFVAMFLGSLILSSGLIALGIDYIRVYTPWHPVIKIGVSILLVCLGFLLFFITMILLEAFNVI
jgi:hypothetical protein